MYCHYVPQVYQRGWVSSLPNEKVYLFNKETGFRCSQQIKIEKNFQETNYYILKLFSDSQERFHYLEFFFDDINSFYKNELQKFDIVLEGNKIIDYEHFFKNIHRLDSFEFWEAGMRKSTHKIKCDMETWWNNNISVIIENFFAKSIENKWNQTLSSVIIILMTNSICK